MQAFARLAFVSISLAFFTLLLPSPVFATTSPFRSASIVTTDGSPLYTNLSNCSATDGNTCDRATDSSYGNLYLRGFGNYGDFGIPQGSTITSVRIRVTGKSSNGVYVGLSAGSTFTENCQWPSDLWALFSSQTITTQTFVSPVIDIFQPGAVRSYCLQPSNFETNNFIWRINYSSVQAWSANIDNFEIAFDYELAPTPTPTPSPTPTVTPTSTPSPTPTPTPTPGPEPFLDLPWDYEGDGLTFSDAANAINSFFDHEYPLLSSGLGEPSGKGNSVIYFRGGLQSFDRDYSSHDGYDYGKPAKVNIDDPVLAAANGEATYINTCDACGNAILIDHKNGYQTRYYHLQYEELIATVSGEKVQVATGDQIGKVGATGNVFPSGEAGAHIHFMLVQDKNNDGNFDDNIPDGVTDPFGWQSKEPDPWPLFAFSYAGQARTGSKSYYLWKKKIDNLDATLTANGGVFKTGKYTTDFPKNATNQDIILNMIYSPIVNTLDNLSSIGSSIVITASDALGNLITSFENFFTLTVDFTSADLTRYKTDTMAIYSSSDGINWAKESTTLDFTTKTASAQLNHLTHFALMAERADTTPPTTNAQLTGQQGQQNWFRSDVSVTLDAQDNEGGLGVDYTMYKIEGKDWEVYTSPLLFVTEEHYKIEFYSADNDENIEDFKSIEFAIDKTIPEAKIFIDQTSKDVIVEGIDSNQTTIIVENQDKKDSLYTISDLAGNSISLDIREKDKEKKDKLSVHALQYNDQAPIALVKNQLKVDFKNFEQKFSIKDEVKIKIKYDAKKNKSTIIIKEPKGEKVKEVRDGLTLLQLKTNQGSLEYSY